jgi:hypothetical protein
MLTGLQYSSCMSGINRRDINVNAWQHGEGISRAWLHTRLRHCKSIDWYHQPLHQCPSNRPHPLYLCSTHVDSIDLRRPVYQLDNKHAWLDAMLRNRHAGTTGLWVDNIYHSSALRLRLFFNQSAQRESAAWIQLEALIFQTAVQFQPLSHLHRALFQHISVSIYTLSPFHCYGRNIFVKSYWYFNILIAGVIVYWFFSSRYSLSFMPTHAYSSYRASHLADVESRLVEDVIKPWLRRAPTHHERKLLQTRKPRKTADIPQEWIFHQYH